MRLWLLLPALALAALGLSRSSLGRRLGNEMRALSDRCMLLFLQQTSQFESES
jgi:hypothetical protein